MAVAIAYTGVINNGASFAAGSGSGQWDTTKNEIVIDCQLTLSGSYGTASSHGDPINFGGVAPPIGASLYDDAPSHWDIKELVQAGSLATGYDYNYCPGPTLAAPTQAGGVLQCLLAGVEYAEGSAYASTLPSGTVLIARFWFARSGD